MAPASDQEALSAPDLAPPAADQGALSAPDLAEDDGGAFSPLRLSPPLVIDVGFSIWQLGIGDIDGDGIPDVAAAGGNLGSPGEGMVVGFNRGGRAFDAPILAAPIGGAPGEEPRIAIGDFNRDGLVDIAFHHGNIYAIENLGARKFGPVKQVLYPFLRGQVLTSFTTADLDHDGNPDLIMCGPGVDLRGEPGPPPPKEPRVLVQFGDGKGGFGAPVGFAADSPRKVTAADLDLDGWADVITGPMAPGHVLFNDHGKFLPPSDPFGDGIVLTAAADMNGDGLPDIVTPGSVTLNLGHRMFGMTMHSMASFMGIFALEFALGDVNHDGRPDIVFSDGSGGYYVELNQGGGTLGDPIMFLHGTHGVALAIADLDGDKKDDLVIGDGNNITIYFNDSP